MARLIDADSLPYENQVMSYDDEWCLKVSDIEKAPTVDAVEVVRCKDCKHRVYVDMGDDIGAIGGCELLGCAMACNAFCSYGERKTDG